VSAGTKPSANPDAKPSAKAADRNDSGARPHRAGFVAILGPPNAGKSTLLNRLLGEKLAIVTKKPQTTRSRILGIMTVPGAQLMLVDTPGLHESTKQLNVALNKAVGEAVKDCDLAVLLVDRTQGWSDAHDRLAEQLQARSTPMIVVGTKCDLRGDPALEWPPAAASGAAACVSISGLTGEGVASLLEAIIAELPVSPPLYPDEELTDRPLRWLCAELVREAVFVCLQRELPYSMAVEVVSFDESRPGLVEIHANLLVERDSQKRIVVGTRGAMVKRIGSRARRPIERLVGCQVNLQLFVKIDPKWLKNAKRIEELGYF
jgi:GTP-binding protein Era